MNKTGCFSLPCSCCGKPLLFDLNNKETYDIINEIFGNYMHPECIKNIQLERITLHLDSHSSEPIIQSGFSPIIQSGEKVKVVTSGGGPVLQSGFSNSYNSGIRNFDKNNKNKSKVSS